MVPLKTKWQPPAIQCHGDTGPGQIMAVTDDNAKEGPTTAVDKTEHLDKVVQEVVEVVPKSCIPVPSCSVVQVEEDDVSAQGRAEEDRILLDEGKVNVFFIFLSV